MRIAAGPEPWIRAETRRGHSLWLLPVASTPVETVISCGELDPPRGWMSAAYGQREPAPAVVFTATATLPWRAITLLVPVAGLSAAPPSVIALRDAHGRPVGVRFETLRRSVRDESSRDDDTVAVA